MSFHKMKAEDLRFIAEQYAVDIDENDNRQTIITKLTESGVTYQYHMDQLEAAKKAEKVQPIQHADVFDEPGEKDDDAVVLLKMTRANGTFEVRGVKFTRDNPYAIVRESDADYIMDAYEGFMIASPKEVKAFYS